MPPGAAGTSLMMTPPCPPTEDYTIGWVCALPVELGAAVLMLDEKHQDPPRHTADTNAYSLGRIGEHNVVIACLPLGQIGTNSAAMVVSQMRLRFTSIKFVLIVGIGGGVPSSQADIRLGDVVISQPNSQNGGVVQYDFGKIGPEGHLTRTGFLNAPPTILLSALAKFQSNRLTCHSNLSAYLFELISRQEDFSSKRAGSDILFEPDYNHIEGQTCDQCSRDRTIERPSREKQGPIVHYGTIASGNIVMKDGVTRDSWSRDLGGVLCFEMEAAGMMNNSPCLVIRGICDYADSHKNKKWQPYAAATAAACAKDLLSVIPSVKVPETSPDESQNSQCLRDLRLTDPRDDKKRIEASKDILLEDCCTWIFQDPDFLNWSHNRNTRLLWIKGDPGKGKTMIMMALIDKLSKDLECGSCVLSYFFCQSTDSRLNNAVAVLRGLIYLLATKQEALIRHLRKRYDTAGSQLFEGQNALYALSAILSDMLNDSSLERVYFMVDALDECDSGLLQLLDVIAPRKPEPSSKIKWLVASRNRPDIEERLRPDGFLSKISLELNPSHISRAVDIFINIRVSELAERKKYGDGLCKEVHSYLSKNAGDTFLWVALVCKELGNVPSWEAQSVLEEFPSGLEPLYSRMMDQIQQGKSEREIQLYQQVLITVTLAFRPMHLKELRATADLPESFPGDLQSMNQLVGLCGSFLTVRGDIVYFVHQSAKDYFGTGRGSLKIFSSDQIAEHLGIARRSLKLMSQTLKRDICDLQMLGALSNEARSINQGLLAHIRYACCYWVDHFHVSYLQQGQVSLYNNDQVHKFFKEHFLHWFEALSLMGKMSKGILMVKTLQSMLMTNNRIELLSLVRDARRFILSHRPVIEMAPLQIYNSALVFSPAKSIIRGIYLDQLPTWIRSLPMVEKSWSPSLQTLESHSSLISAVAFSPDGRLLVSGSWDETVCLWDPATGAIVQTLRGHSGSVHAVAFSPDSQFLASGSWDKTVRLWDTATWTMVQTLTGHSGSVNAVAFSSNSKLLASGSNDNTIRLWNPTTGAMLWTLIGHSSSVNAVAFSPRLAFWPPYSQLLASGSNDETIRVWDPTTGAIVRTLKNHSGSVNAVAFSPDSQFFASGSWDNEVQLWDPSTWSTIQTLKGHSNSVYAVTFSPDSRLLASTSSDRTVRLWDPTTMATVQILTGHSSVVSTATFSPDSQLLASGSWDNTVRLWDPAIRATVQKLTGHSGSVNTVVFSPENRLLASGSDDKTILLWDPATGTIVQKLTGHSSSVNAVAFSPDSTLAHYQPCSPLLASGSDDKTVRIWDFRKLDIKIYATYQRLAGSLSSVPALAFSPDSQLLAFGSNYRVGALWDLATRDVARMLPGRFGPAVAVTFSPDSQLLASGSLNGTVHLWDLATGLTVQTMLGHSSVVKAVAFSPDSRLLASASGDNTVRLWDPATGATIRTLIGHSAPVNTVAFSPDSRLLASGSVDGTICLWDSATEATIQTLTGHSKSVLAVAFSPDNRFLASGSEDQTIRVWDLDTGAAVQALTGHSSWVSTVIFSPDGRLLVSGSWDATVRLWDPATGVTVRILNGFSGPVSTLVFLPDSRLAFRLQYSLTLASVTPAGDVVLWDIVANATVQTMTGHSDSVNVVAFSPDGQLLASGSDDKTIRLWDLDTRATMETLIGHSDSVSAVVFSPDNQLLASGSSDKTVLLWNVNTKECIQQFATRYRPIKLLFSPDGSSLETDREEIQFSLSPAHPSSSPSSPRSSYSLDKTQHWVTWNSQNILFLPPDRRPRDFVIEDNILAMGHHSGRVTFIEFRPNLSPLEQC